MISPEILHMATQFLNQRIFYESGTQIYFQNDHQCEASYWERGGKCIIEINHTTGMMYCDYREVIQRTAIITALSDHNASKLISQYVKKEFGESVVVTSMNIC